MVNLVLKLIKKLYPRIFGPWKDSTTLGTSRKPVGSVNIKVCRSDCKHTNTCLLPDVRTSQNYKACNLFVICCTFYLTGSSTYYSSQESSELRGIISLLSILDVSWKKPLSVLSSVGVRCIIDLTFLSHCWKIENNPSVINKLFSFPDFNNWHWCSFLAHDGLKWTQILKQNKSLNHKVAQIRRLVMPVQTEIQNFGTTPPKTWDNWEYRPTAWKLNVTLLLSADSSEKKNTCSVVNDWTQLHVLH